MPHLTKDQLANVAREVAPFLGEDWRPSGNQYQRDTLRGPGPLAIYFANRRSGRTHIVRGVLPPGACRIYTAPGELDGHEIGVDLTRPPEAIAREIKRRLLPHYAEKCRALVARIAEDDAYERERERVCKAIRLAAPEGVTVQSKNSTTAWVRLELTEEQARAVFAFLSQTEEKNP